jgi:predicted branched-subunit amino acid permease
MKASTKEMFRRALRTFLQAAVGYVSVNIAYAFANAGEDYDLLASSLLGV